MSTTWIRSGVGWAGVGDSVAGDDGVGFGYHWGKAWRRLKAPGGRRSCVAVLSESLSEGVEDTVAVVRGVKRGWKTSVLKTISGGAYG